MGVLCRASPIRAGLWFALLLMKSALPVLFAITTSMVIGSVVERQSVAVPLTALCVVFVAMQIAPPVLTALGETLGDRAVDWLNGRLMRATTGPAGIGHLERSAITDLLVRARDFDLALSGPPISVAMGFIASGLSQLLTGLMMCGLLATYHWWAAAALAVGWGATHWFLRDSAVWRGRFDQESSDAQRSAEYLYRLAVDAHPAKEVRVFGLGDWLGDNYRGRRELLVRLRFQATRLHRGRVVWSAIVIALAHLLVFGTVAWDLSHGTLGSADSVRFLLAAIGTSGIAFGGLNSVLSMCGQVARSVFTLEEELRRGGEVSTGYLPADGLPERNIRFKDVHFSYSPDGEPVLAGLNLDIPVGTSVALVGLNGAGKTTIAKLLSRLHDPTRGSIEVDGINLRDIDVSSWRTRLAVIYQDFIRFDASLSDNVSFTGADEATIRAALVDAGGEGLRDLQQMLGRGYDDSSDLSGGQWQRVAIARALTAVREGARVVVFDEPTAQIDVRSELAIFNRLTTATASCTRILISHRFATVRQADMIHVLEKGRVLESGNHEELMARQGRYYTMYRAQASRFSEDADD